MRLDLDLSTQEFLTDPDVTDPKQIHVGGHYLRQGDPDPKSLAHGGHPGGDPIRIARDRISGKYYARVFEHLPQSAETARDERLLSRFKELKPIPVHGHGWWVPLDVLHPDHPHSVTYNGSQPDADRLEQKRQQKIEAARKRQQEAMQAARLAEAELSQLQSAAL